MELNANQLLQIKKILESKEWYTEEFYELYCNFLTWFKTEEEIDLILKLTKNFLWIHFEEYLKYLKELLNMLYVQEKYLKQKTVIVVCPLLSFLDEDVYKTKSSNFLCYLFKSHEIQNLRIFKEKKNKVLEQVYTLEKTDENEYNKKLNISDKDKKDDRIILLIDDFIGSGETAENAIKFYVDTCGFKIENIRVLSIVIQEQGLKKIEEIIQENQIYYIYSLKKGMSQGNYTDKELEIMKKIEEKLNVTKEKFGYKQSEGLVTLIRTPNNTFPVFRMKKNMLLPIFLRG